MSEPKSYLLKVATETTIDELAENVNAMIHDHDELLEFVLRLDEAVADLDFTEELYRRLGKVLEAEYAADPELVKAGGSGRAALSEERLESTLPTHVQHLVSGDVAKVLAWHSEGYTADFGAGPEYVKALDVRPVRAALSEETR
ncbi:hypothetical protein ABZ215_24850 [Amycolatopsis sp. NPDC006131]|uniref:hypothetical protein n=1 Tax=Amycolatopsis sp. NPDC006131 TaxID=3156731 RepID=UPI0033B5BD0A